MDKKLKMVTGKTEENEVRDLGEIISGRKANKFSKYSDRAEYRKALFGMSHMDLCNEMMRLGLTPSQIPETCRKRCLDTYDRSMAPRKITHPSSASKNLDDILEDGRKPHKS